MSLTNSLLFKFIIYAWVVQQVILIHLLFPFTITFSSTSFENICFTVPPRYNISQSFGGAGIFSNELINKASSSKINKYLLPFLMAFSITLICDSKHPRFGFSCKVAV